MFRPSQLIPAVLIGGGFFLGSALPAAPIAIVNPSFEDDATNTGTGNSVPTTGWTHSVALSGFNMGTYNITPAGFFDPSAIPEGTGTVWMNINGYMSQILSETLAADATYALSAYVGLRQGNNVAGHLYALQLLAGGSLLAEVTGQMTTSDYGAFRQVSVGYVAPANVAPGQSLEIRLVHQSANSFHPQLAWDLVALDATVPASSVPEPAGTTLGGLLLLCLSMGAASGRRPWGAGRTRSHPVC